MMIMRERERTHVDISIEAKREEGKKEKRPFVFALSFSSSLTLPRLEKGAKQLENERESDFRSFFFLDVGAKKKAGTSDYDFFIPSFRSLFPHFLLGD